MAILTGIKNTNSKERELELGALVQAGINARNQLESGGALTDSIRTKLTEAILLGQDAEEELFNTHISQANKIASNLVYKTGTNYSVEDLAQDAYAALIHAVRTYKPEKNCVLSTHAFYVISKAVSVTINKMRIVRVPENRMGDHLHITRAEQEYDRLTHGLGNEADRMQYVMDQTGLKKEVILLIKQTLRTPLSTNAPVGESGTERGDLIASRDTEEANSPAIDVLFSLLDELPIYERDIVTLMSGVGQVDISADEFMKKHSLDQNKLKKEFKRILSKLSRQASLEGFTVSRT